MTTKFKEAREGVMDMLPIALAALPFALLLGSEAVHRGLSPAELSLMSLVVFAGSAQFLTVSIWSHPAPWASLAFATLLINLRHLLMSASLSSKVERFTPLQRACAAFVMADETWALNERRAKMRVLTPSYYAGTALCLYVIWFLGSIAGTSFGDRLPPPESIGFDFVFSALFISLITSFARTSRSIPVIAASLGVALIVKSFFGGMAFIIAGGLAGVIAAAALPPEQKDAL